MSTPSSYVSVNQADQLTSLVVHDLFRSGETLDAVAAVLVAQGKVGKISVVTATMTRSRR